MATTKDFKDYVCVQLGKIFTDIVCRSMMGEYLLYNDSVLFGGIYDNRVLIKIVEENKKFGLNEEIPYKGAKAMFHLSDMENLDFVRDIILTTCKSLPKKKK